MIAFSGSRKTMIRLITKIFYANVDDGVDLFAACLGSRSATGRRCA
ncbi:MAG: hypothetical protein ABI277_11030 [Burkholderiaceae bacterium]